MVYVVDVAWSTHELLQQGVTERGWHRCTVEASNEIEAELIAAQMVAATTGMPTKSLLCI